MEGPSGRTNLLYCAQGPQSDPQSECHVMPIENLVSYSITLAHTHSLPTTICRTLSIPCNESQGERRSRQIAFVRSQYQSYSDRLRAGSSNEKQVRFAAAGWRRLPPFGVCVFPTLARSEAPTLEGMRQPRKKGALIGHEGQKRATPICCCYDHRSTRPSVICQMRKCPNCR